MRRRDVGNVRDSFVSSVALSVFYLQDAKRQHQEVIAVYRTHLLSAVQVCELV